MIGTSMIQFMAGNINFYEKQKNRISRFVQYH